MGELKTLRDAPFGKFLLAYYSLTVSEGYKATGLSFSCVLRQMASVVDYNLLLHINCYSIELSDQLGQGYACF